MHGNSEISFSNYQDEDSEDRRRFRSILSGLIAALGTAYTALTDGGITLQEGVGIALTAVIAVSAVYGVKASQ